MLVLLAFRTEIHRNGSFCLLAPAKTADGSFDGKVSVPQESDSFLLCVRLLLTNGSTSAF
ncbi:hypothetical protein CSUI_005355 [Cystoisospora suis]|uniref:Uncharacterized protein n=1 Tax=Cystoisospora suis TaxID=483139 RepID=A0A2C6KYA2_9APIC|nr:hypothetical protein CSUI_005355 [Cystoisospora suis]